MIPVDQVRTGYGRGQCTEATYASLLEVPLEAVPDLWAGPHVPPDAPGHLQQPEEHHRRLEDWLRERFGLVQVTVAFPGFPRTVEATWAHAVSALTFQGVEVEGAPWARFHAAGGDVAGGPHLVVAELGRVVHDPNPARLGLEACWAIVWLVPLDALPPFLVVSTHLTFEVKVPQERPQWQAKEEGGLGALGPAEDECWTCDGDAFVPCPCGTPGCDGTEGWLDDVCF